MSDVDAAGDRSSLQKSQERKGPTKQLAQVPPSPGKQQQAEKVLNHPHFSSTKPFGVCALFSLALLPGKGRALHSVR